WPASPSGRGGTASAVTERAPSQSALTGCQLPRRGSQGESPPGCTTNQNPCRKAAHHNYSLFIFHSSFVTPRCHSGAFSSDGGADCGGASRRPLRPGSGAAAEGRAWAWPAAGAWLLLLALAG